jgi:hypothetical protein
MFFSRPSPGSIIAVFFFGLPLAQCFFSKFRSLHLLAVTLPCRQRPSLNIRSCSSYSFVLFALMLEREEGQFSDPLMPPALQRKLFVHAIYNDESDGFLSLITLLMIV